MHSLGIVHRDLKLENIMMSSDSDDACAKIADFGLATLLGPTQTAGESYGTLGYTAPEVLKKEQYGAQCDVWSLGCMVYAMMSGHMPFSSREDKELR